MKNIDLIWLNTRVKYFRIIYTLPVFKRYFPVVGRFTVISMLPKFGISYTISLMTNLRPVRTTYVNESVYNAIESAILQGELPPHSSLNDRKLAELLGVSRTPIRDALHRLESSGLVERVERGARARWVVTGIDPQGVKEIFELRRALEPLGLEGLAKTWDVAIVNELSGFFQDFPDRLPRELYPEYLRRDHVFHRRIAECSQNTRLINFHNILEHQTERIRYYHSYGYEGRVDTSLGEHRRICKSIGERDLQMASTLLIEHLRNAENGLLSVLAVGHTPDQRVDEGRV